MLPCKFKHLNVSQIFCKNQGNIGKKRRKTVRCRKRTRKQLQTGIANILAKTRLPKNLLKFTLTPLVKDAFDLDFWIDTDAYRVLKEQWFGRRILMTNRHDWSIEQIVQAYWGQFHVEWAFKTIKNLFHLSLIPQYYWTDRKIEVHAFICLIAFPLTMIAYNQAKEKANFKGSPQTFLEKLSAIRLATFIESPTEKSKGKYKATYRLEKMDEDIRQLAQFFNLEKSIHKKKHLLVYTLSSLFMLLISNMLWLYLLLNLTNSR